MNDNSDIYYIGGLFANGIFNFAFNKKTKQIHENSCEWIYLPVIIENTKNIIVNKINYTINNRINYSNINNLYKDECVVPLISSWATGTTHGYAALYYFLNYYLNNIEKFKNYKIAFYKYSQKGMFDIIDYLIKINKLDKNDIIYLDKKPPKKFKRL